MTHTRHIRDMTDTRHIRDMTHTIVNLYCKFNRKLTLENFHQSQNHLRPCPPNPPYVVPYLLISYARTRTQRHTHTHTHARALVYVYSVCDWAEIGFDGATHTRTHTHTRTRTRTHTGMNVRRSRDRLCSSRERVTGIRKVKESWNSQTVSFLVNLQYE